MEWLGCERSELQIFCCKKSIVEKIWHFNSLIELHHLELLMNASTYTMSSAEASEYVLCQNLPAEDRRNSPQNGHSKMPSFNLKKLPVWSFHLDSGSFQAVHTNVCILV